VTAPRKPEPLTENDPHYIPLSAEQERELRDEHHLTKCYGPSAFAQLFATLDAARARITALEAERDEARKWATDTVAAVVAERIVTCVYCGHEYPTGTPASQDAALTCHIRVCEKHPMRAVEAERDALRGEVEALRLTLAHEEANNEDEVREFNAGYESARTGHTADCEPSHTRHDVWQAGHAWGVACGGHADSRRLRALNEGGA
jgi:hypothetical protein